MGEIGLRVEDWGREKKREKREKKKRGGLVLLFILTFFFFLNSTNWRNVGLDANDIGRH